MSDPDMSREPPPSQAPVDAFHETAMALKELAKAFAANLVFIASAQRRAHLLMFVTIIAGGATVVFSVFLLREVMRTRERIEIMAGRVEELAQSVDRVEKTAESTETKIDETQEAIAETPVLDVVQKTATTATPGTAAAKATAVLVVKQRKTPATATATAAAVPSFELPLPLPTIEPEKKAP